VPQLDIGKTPPDFDSGFEARLKNAVYAAAIWCGSGNKPPLEMHSGGLFSED
jgi:hypothetical protein